MVDTADSTRDFSNLIETWLNTATRFWQDFGAAQAEPEKARPFFFSGVGTDDSSKNDSDSFRTYKTWETGANNLISILKLMSAPENQEAVMRGMSGYMQALMEASGESLDNMAEMQARLVDFFTKLADHTKAYNLDDLDHAAFESFRDFYREEIQKYIHMPKIGLPRQFHEQLSILIDRTTIFHSHLFELLFLFHQPFERTNRKRQEKIKKMLEDGEFVSDPKQAYNEWIRTLEGHFMELLKSREYLQVLNDTISSLADYRNIRTDVAEIFLKDLQIPTNNEMDEVYRDLYQTKKKLKSLESEIHDLRNELKALSG